MSGMKRISSFFPPTQVKKQTIEQLAQEKQQSIQESYENCSNSTQASVKVIAKDSSHFDGEVLLTTALKPDDSVVSSSSKAACLESFSTNLPCHPENISIIPNMQSGKKILRFQSKWFEDYPWLHYAAELNAVVCFYCAKVCHGSALPVPYWAKNAEQAFVSSGYRNWKKALGKNGGFEKHQRSHSHILAVNHCSQQKHPISKQLCNQIEKNQNRARKCLRFILTSLRYLSGQGQAIRGHEDESGNFENLLLLRSEDEPDLKQWLHQHNSYTSPAVQNEFFQLMANSILREIRDEILTDGKLTYAFIMDGTTDITMTEQESCCIRFVDKDLQAQEVFVGMYAPNETTGKELCRVVKDVLLRFNLPLSSMRAQTYDGAANMSGAYSGCQALIKEENHLALYVHCGAHCSNLVMESVVNAHPFVRDAVQWVHELGAFSKHSRKFKSVLSRIAQDHDKAECALTLKPLCPTRWTVRAHAIQTVLSQYHLVLDALSEITESGVGEAKTKANGLFDRFSQGNTLLGLKMVIQIFELLENLNCSLQGRNQTVTGMMNAVSFTSQGLEKLRNEK